MKYFSTLKERLKRPRFWIIFLSAGLATSLVIAIVALIGVRSVIEPPARGQFYEVLQRPALDDITNTTNTLFEHTADELSGGVIPIILFRNATNFCGDDSDYELKISACVDRFNPIYIAFSEEFAQNLENAYEDAIAKGLTDEAELINQWESHIAAHEFAHVLQYNYRSITLPFQEENFKNGALGRANENMAECYAQRLYPLTDAPAEKIGDFENVEFHGFPSAERIALCTTEQMNAIEEWLKAIPYPIGNKVDL